MAAQLLQSRGGEKIPSSLPILTFRFLAWDLAVEGEDEDEAEAAQMHFRLVR